MIGLNLLIHDCMVFPLEATKLILVVLCIGIDLEQIHFILFPELPPHFDIFTKSCFIDCRLVKKSFINIE